MRSILKVWVCVGLCALFHLPTLSAKPVLPATAQRVAENLLRKQVVDVTPATFTECYLFAAADGKGFALIAADDCVRPVLGYSPDGVFSTDSLPDHIGDWIKAYQNNIASLKAAGAPAVDIKYRRVRDTAVGPLLATTWNQSPYYNSLCPPLNTDSRAVTGCVATATAQVMKYWNHPAVGRGSHSYDTPNGTLSANFDTTHYLWDSMPVSLNRFSSATAVEAVSQLMLHIGIAVEMTYGNSSGACVSSNGDPNMASSENALKNYFRYNQALFGVARVDCTDAEWDRLITADLDASRPILISGHDNDGGHAFVLDGYDTLGLYHVNWGWGGYCDGYYIFDSLSPGAGGIGSNATNSYNQDVRVLLHVYPASESSSVSVNVVPRDPLQGTVTGGGTFPTYTSTTVAATAAEGYRFIAWTSGNRYNPFRFAPNHDYRDTALFQRLSGDTLGYCFGAYGGLWGEYAGTAPEWGIRIPASVIAAHRQLNAIQFYGVSNSTYTYKIYFGNTPDQLVCSGNVTTAGFDWYTVQLPFTIPLVTPQPIWIVLSCNSYLNPAVYTQYSGNPDGSWYKRNGTTWEHLEGRNVYSSWMIRAILGDLEQVHLDVISGDETRGTVTGSGDYYPGDTALLTATALPGFTFAGWSTGHSDNPLHLCVTEAATIIASFIPSVAIADIDNLSPAVQTSGLTLSVSNPQGLECTLYDAIGRKHSTFSSKYSTLTLPSPGVYLLHYPGGVKKIVIH